MTYMQVFMFEYAGPIVMVSLLLGFRKKIYKTDKPLTLN